MSGVPMKVFWPIFSAAVREGMEKKFDGSPRPTFLPLMKRPDKQVQKANAEKEMRDLLKRTRLMLNPNAE